MMKLFPLILCVLAARAVAATEQDQPPNVVLLLADDLGWTGLRCFGSDLYETPHLDRLANTGMKFTQAYAACTVCSPTRASLMTGMYPARLHLTDFIAGQFRPYARMRVPAWTKHLEHRYVTIAEALRDRGYHTAHIGKWHLQPKTRPRRGNPTTHGFAVSHGRPGGLKGYFLADGSNADGESGSDYLTDYLTDLAVNVIDDNHQQPFFLYVAFSTPHTPIDGRPDLVQRFRKKVKEGAEHNNPVYAAMVGCLDDNVGRILQRLQRHKIADNTIVIFLSDNGGLTQRYGKPDHFTSNAPLRRGKGSAFEGGVRVPMIIRAPGVTAADTVTDQPVMSTDLYPTILAMTGTPGAAAHNKSVDGIDLSTLLRSPATTIERDLFWHYPHYHAGGDGPYSAIRSGRWKLIESLEDRSLQLYDLQQDPGETFSLAASMPDRRDDLQIRLHTWRRSVDAQMPTENPDYDPDRATDVGKVRKRP